MSLKKIRIKQRFQFFLERQLVKGAHHQLLYVALLIGLISIVGGVLVLPSGEPTGNFGDAVWWAFLRLSDPGYLGDDEGIWRRFISTLITVAGYVVFLGALVAIITTALNRKIRNLEQGLTPVVAKNHLLVLGWTNRTIHIAAEIFQSVGRLKRFLKLHGTRSLQLIILSEDVTPDHLQELRDNPLIGDRALEIILRSGIAIDREHLRRVDSLNAAAIIIPSQSYSVNELVTPDIETIKALLSINAEAEGDVQKLPLIVAEIQDENKLSAAYGAYSGPLEIIASNTILSRLIAQNIRHHGLSEVYNELLSRSVNNNLFAREYPGIKGHTITEVKYSFPKALVLGVVRQDGEEFKPLLNLPPDSLIEKGDLLVLLARNSADIDITPELSKPSQAIKTLGLLPIEEQSGVKKLLILGWSHHVPALIKEFSTYENERYHITIASLRPLEDRYKELEYIGGAAEQVKVEHLVVDYVKEAELRKVNPAGFDNILLVSSDRLVEEEEADARTIVGYVMLEEILEGSDKRPHVLLELSDPSNESLIRRFRSEVIIGPMILSHLLAAIALRRELNSIYNELFTVGGAEIIFRNPIEYGYHEKSITFSELESRAEQYHETALGIYIEGENPKESKLTLNPSHDEELNISGNVQLVVLTTIS